jgi:hypothetical protein
MPEYGHAYKWTEPEAGDQKNPSPRRKKQEETVPRQGAGGDQGASPFQHRSKWGSSQAPPLIV